MDKDINLKITTLCAAKIVSKVLQYSERNLNRLKTNIYKIKLLNFKHLANKNRKTILFRFFRLVFFQDLFELLGRDKLLSTLLTSPLTTTPVSSLVFAQLVEKLNFFGRKTVTSNEKTSRKNENIERKSVELEKQFWELINTSLSTLDSK